MEPRPPHKPRRRKIKPAPPEYYPDIDFDRVREIAESLKDCKSDLEAIRMVTGNRGLVGIVHQEVKKAKKKDG